MPDLSDKVSERPNDIPQDVLEAARNALNARTYRQDLDYLTVTIANAIMADRRTRPAASTMEGWQTMDNAPTGKVVLLWKPATREIYVATRMSGEHGPGWCTLDGFEIFGAEAWQYPPDPPIASPILPTAQHEDSKK